MDILLMFLFPAVVLVVGAATGLMTRIAETLACHSLFKQYSRMGEAVWQKIDTRQQALDYLNGPAGERMACFWRLLGWYRFLIVAGLIDGVLLLYLVTLQIDGIEYVILGLMGMFTFAEYMSGSVYRKIGKKLENEQELKSLGEEELLKYAANTRNDLKKLEEMPSSRWRTLVTVTGAVAAMLACLQIYYCLIPHSAGQGLWQVRGFQYRVLEDGGAELTGYTGIWKRIRVPQQLGGHPVTVIGEKAFYKPVGGDYLAFGRKDLEEVLLPEGIRRIEAHAFDGCGDVKSLRLPDSVVFIGNQAFSDSEIKELTLPLGLQEIDGNPFNGQNILLPEDHPVFCVRDGALLNQRDGVLVCFMRQTDATEYRVPDGIKRINDYAFQKSRALKSVLLPEGLASIGERAFSYCESLETIELPDSVTHLGDGVFYNCRALRQVRLPGNLEAIGESMFYDCSSLKAIDLPETIKTIGSHAFCGCAFQEFTVPSSIEAIEIGTFDRCKNLRRVTVSEGIKTIDGFAFGECSSLETIILPSSLQDMHMLAMYGANKACVFVVAPGSEAERWCKIYEFQYRYPEGKAI